VVARAAPAAFGPLLRNVLRACRSQSEATSGSQFSLISRSSVAEQRLDKAQVGGSFPPAGTNLHLGVAQMAARVIWDHEAAGSLCTRSVQDVAKQRAEGQARSASRPATETRQACAWVWP
jgi:hypothetical protein